jgi:uncharacterized protein (DUF433 family)
MNIYGGQDPRAIPAYSIPEAAHYLRLPPSTLRSWVRGGRYPIVGGKRTFEPVITLPQSPSDSPTLLSFINLVEAHVLRAIRRDHKIALPKVREALVYLATQLPSKHPLVEQEFETDGLDLFTTYYGQLINITKAGQLTMRQAIQVYLRRIERDPNGIPIRLYPFTRSEPIETVRTIVIDPYVSFGRPVLAGTGIVTAIIAERYRAGESIDDLATDYRRSRPEIEEALRCEMPLIAA